MIYETEGDRKQQAAAYERICKARARGMMGPLPISYYIDSFLIDTQGYVVAATEYLLNLTMVLSGGSTYVVTRGSFRLYGVGIQTKRKNPCPSLSG